MYAAISAASASSTLRTVFQVGAVCFAAWLLSACVTHRVTADLMQLEQQVQSTERAFAKTLAERDLAAFTQFVADDAVFFSGPQPLHGKQQVVAWWQRYFVQPAAPFSWQPQQVAVLSSGRLALSSGPVRDPEGKLIGTFTSIWRQQAPGVWRIVFDKGSDVCP